MIKVLLLAFTEIWLSPVGDQVSKIRFFDAKPNLVVQWGSHIGHYVTYINLGVSARHKKTGSIYWSFEDIAGNYPDLDVASAGRLEFIVGDFNVAVGYLRPLTMTNGDVSNFVEQLVFDYPVINKKRHLDQSICVNGRRLAVISDVAPKCKAMAVCVTRDLNKCRGQVCPDLSLAYPALVKCHVSGHVKSAFDPVDRQSTKQKSKKCENSHKPLGKAGLGHGFLRQI